MTHILTIIIAVPLALFSLTGDITVLNSPENIRDLAYHNNKIYCATSGGLQVIDVATGKVTKAGGTDNEVNGSGVAVVTVDPSDGKVYAGFDNGTICAISASGSVKKYPDFNRRETKFLRFFTKNGILVIGTNKGLAFFVENESPVGYPFIERFGDSTNQYISLGKEIRDITVKGDTLYILTPYFWAKTTLVWQRPFLTINSDLWTASAGRWTTNGAAGDFAYVPPGGGAIEGFKRFLSKPNILQGIHETALCEATNSGAVFSAKMDSGKVFVTCRYPGSIAGLSVGDVDSFLTTLPNSAQLISICTDNAGRFYAGTSNRGVIRLNDNHSYWNGEVQPFLLSYKLKTDHDGNLYALNIENASTAWENAQGCLGIIKWSHEIGWRQLHYTLAPYLLPGVNDIAIDGHGRLFASIAEIFDQFGHSLILGNNYNDPDGNRIYPNETIIAFDNPWQTEISTIRPINFRDTNRCANPGTHTGSILYDRNGYFYYAVAHDQNNHRISIFKDLSYIWKSENGLSIFNYDCYNNGGFKPVATIYSSHFPDAVFDRLKSMTSDKSGNIWFVNGAAPSPILTVIGKNILTSSKSALNYYSTNPAKPSEGLMVKNGYKQANTGVPESKRGLDAFLAEKKVNTIATDIFGDIWVATTAGLFYYSEGRDSSMYGNIDGNWRFFLQGMNINCIDFDSLNNAWVGTDSGLCMVDFTTARYPTEDVEYGTGDRKNIQIISYTQLDGLLKNTILSLAVNKKSGKVFIGTSEGIQMLASGSFFPDQGNEHNNTPGIASRNSSIQITARAPGSTITIYTLSGKRVLSVKLPTYQTTYIWNCLTPNSNTRVSPGVYLYKCVTPSNSVSTGKFALIR